MKRNKLYTVNRWNKPAFMSNMFDEGGVQTKGLSSNKGATWQAIGSTALNAASAINTGDRNGMFDTLDPVQHLAGGRESKVGNALSDTGVALTKSGNPWMMLAGAGLKIVFAVLSDSIITEGEKQLKEIAPEMTTPPVVKKG